MIEIFLPVVSMTLMRTTLSFVMMTLSSLTRALMMMTVMMVMTRAMALRNQMIPRGRNLSACGGVFFGADDGVTSCCAFVSARGADVPDVSAQSVNGGTETFCLANPLMLLVWPSSVLFGAASGGLIGALSSFSSSFSSGFFAA